MITADKGFSPRAAELIDAIDKLCLGYNVEEVAAAAINFFGMSFSQLAQANKLTLEEMLDHYDDNCSAVRESLIHSVTGTYFKEPGVTLESLLTKKS